MIDCEAQTRPINRDRDFSVLAAKPIDQLAYATRIRRDFSAMQMLGAVTDLAKEQKPHLSHP